MSLSIYDPGYEDFKIEVKELYAEFRDNGISDDTFWGELFAILIEYDAVVT